MARQRPRARRRGARGQVPRPFADPAADRDPARARLAAARAARQARARLAPAALRDRGADLVLPALPHVAARAARGRRLSRPLVLARARARGDPRRARRSTRSRASDAATRRRWRSSRSAIPSRTAARTGRPNDPYSSAGEHYRTYRELTGDPVPVLDDSGLKGMGGAGFPTGKKWAMVRGQDDPIKYVVCNADEAEPGTFKDRQILAEQPHLVVEGMLIAMRTVGAQQGWVFVRHEYEPEEQRAARGARPRPRRRPARRRLDRRVHLPRRLHPGRGDRAAGVHGGPPRRAAQQAAVPGRLRAPRAADADEQRRDVRVGPDHPRRAARSGGRTRASTAARG